MKWLTVKPAETFGLSQAGRIALGQPADIAIFDLNSSHKIAETDYLSKGTNTPFTGDEVYGQTSMTIVDGKVVYQKEGN